MSNNVWDGMSGNQKTGLIGGAIVAVVGGALIGLNKLINSGCSFSAGVKGYGTEANIRVENPKSFRGRAADFSSNRMIEDKEDY